MTSRLNTPPQTVLALDLSTTCTGWACFASESRQLIEYGVIKASTRGLANLEGIEKTLQKMLNLIENITELVETYQPDLIVVEEIAGAASRLTQKTLDGFHWLLFYSLGQKWRSRIVLYDVTGSDGWRTHLNLRLSEADENHNKEAKKLNPRLTKGQKIGKIGPKHLACRFANHKFGLGLDCEKRVSDGDIADAVSMGFAYIHFNL